jgi:parvulin-like peptidyl-prolyl isomerase
MAKLSRVELEAVIRDLVILREQVMQIAEELGIKYTQALLFLVLRETVILNKKIDSILQLILNLEKQENI